MRKHHRVAAWIVFLLIFFAGVGYYSAGSSVRERRALIGAALVAQGCAETPIVGKHIPALTRSDGPKQDHRVWFTFPVEACGSRWNVEVIEGSAPMSVTSVEKVK